MLYFNSNAVFPVVIFLSFSEDCEQKSRVMWLKNYCRPEYLCQKHAKIICHQYINHLAGSLQSSMTVSQFFTSCCLVNPLPPNTGKIGCIFIHLFVYLLEQQNGNPIALLSFYYTMHLQRWHQCQCYLSYFGVILVYMSIGRNK